MYLVFFNIFLKKIKDHTSTNILTQKSRFEENYRFEGNCPRERPRVPVRSSEWQTDPGDELNQETSFFLTSGVVDKWWQ